MLSRRQIAHFQQHLRPTRLLPIFTVVTGLQRATDHQAVQAVFRSIGRRHLGNHLAIFEHIHPITKVQQLIQPVGNEYERGPRLQLAHQPEEDVDLSLLQRRGRLIQQDH
ncbi:hypothetical protein D3C78_1152240 [compost metagenome]